MLKRISLLMLAILLMLSVKTNTYAIEQKEIEIPAITTPIKITEEDLKELLSDELKDNAISFIDAQYYYCEDENRDGLNALAIASIAIHESGHGKSNIAQNKNNLFGWRSKSSYMTFLDFDECIDYCADKISKNYVEKNLNTFDLIGPKYCNDNWSKYINEIYCDIYMNYINNYNK